MTRILLICVASVTAALPAKAQENNGKSLMERGAEMFLEGLRQEMEPSFDELLGFADQFGPAMQTFIQEMGPALAELAAQVQDWGLYETPEMLPNGDIIIRKKPQPEEPEPPRAQEPSTEEFTDI
ncbi:hypothetical protein [Ruegeria arenilitoris]|uniref:hypothetical protein n=1 Tax=Ruegeria arenilitoris TaxID=1173585 RepID=UPI00147F77B9|nr:hypothetical protein [Ruegeria arenilitoris]